MRFFFVPFPFNACVGIANAWVFDDDDDGSSTTERDEEDEDEDDEDDDGDGDDDDDEDDVSRRLAVSSSLENDDACGTER